MWENIFLSEASVFLCLTARAFQRDLVNFCINLIWQESCLELSNLELSLKCTQVNLSSLTMIFNRWVWIINFGIQIVPCGMQRLMKLTFLSCINKFKCQLIILFFMPKAFGNSFLSSIDGLINIIHWRLIFSITMRRTLTRRLVNLRE